MNDDTALMPVVRREGDHAVGSSSLDILVLRLDQHVVQQRWQLPEPGAIEGDRLGLWERWALLAVLPEGLLLAHSTNQRLLSWELYDPSTRALSLVTDLRGLSSDRQ